MARRYSSRQKKDNVRIYMSFKKFQKRKAYIQGIKHNRTKWYLQRAFGGFVK